MHEHVHGSQECHQVDPGGGSGWSRHHCPDGQHQHEHNASPCHSLSIAHCDGEGDHAHELTTPSGLSMNHWCHPASTPHCGANEHYHDGLDCHNVSANNCPAGQHEHVATVRLGCHDPSTVHHSSTGVEVAISILDLGICGPLLLLPKGFSSLADGCSALMEELRKDAEERTDKKNEEHDKTTTTEGPPTPTTTPKGITWAEVTQALSDYAAGLITREEYEAIVDRWDCQNGWQPACK